MSGTTYALNSILRVNPETCISGGSNSNYKHYEDKPNFEGVKNHMTIIPKHIEV